MTLKSLVYVSTSVLSADTAPDDVATLVDSAQLKNAELAVTGVLIFTGNHFAQAIEGPADAMDILTEAILADPRHQISVILERGKTCVRRFEGWSLGYSGASIYVRDLVERCATTVAGVRNSNRDALIALMMELGRQAVPPVKNTVP